MKPGSDGTLAFETTFEQSAYLAALTESGHIAAFEAAPSYATARALAVAIYDALHDSAPEGARIALMSSGGKDSSAAVFFYLESVAERNRRGLRFIPATIFFGNTGHEFPEMARRQEAECETLSRFGAKYNIRAEIVRPLARDTVLAELIGSGLALPPRAMNNKVAAAGVANWCVSRVKSGPLDAAVAKAYSLAPQVFQILGTRFDESESRAYKMRKYAEGFAFGLSTLANAPSHVTGVTPIAHMTDEHIRAFVHNEIAPHRFASNLELEEIYSRAGKPGRAVGECAIRRTEDGKLAAGCSGLASSTRLGCALCAKASNRALDNLAQVDPKRYALLWRLQQTIYRHHDLHTAGRLPAARMAGFTPDTLFPKGFTFRQRYIWLVMLFAVEITSGDTHLTAEQKDWIQRRWRRHGVFTVDVADAEEDARRWLAAGSDGEPEPWFDDAVEYAADFTESLGESVPLGALAAHTDDNFVDLNYAHLIGLGISGTPLLPTLLSYVFRDRTNHNELLVMVTDTPSILGTPTNTGLLNGQLGIRYEAIGVRPPSVWEQKMSEGRHFFYRIQTSDIRSRLDAWQPAIADRPVWELGDFVAGRDDGAMHELVTHSFNVNLMSTLDVLSGGLDMEPLSHHYRRVFATAALTGISRESLIKSLAIVGRLAGLTDYLQERTQRTYRSILADLRAKLGNDWSLLESGNDEGRTLRRSVNARISGEVFTDDGREAFADYVLTLREVMRLHRAGSLNPALAHRLAFIARSLAVYPPDGEKLFDELAASLGARAA